MTAADPEPAAGVVFKNLVIKSFVVDVNAALVHLVENSWRTLFTSVPLDDTILKAIAKVDDIKTYKIADLPIKAEGTTYRTRVNYSIDFR